MDFSGVDTGTGVGEYGLEVCARRLSLDVRKERAALAQYSPDMCPRTLDLMSRAIFINLSPSWTKTDCDRIATGINKVLAAYHGPAAEQVGW